MGEEQHGGRTGEQWTATVPPGRGASPVHHDPGVRRDGPLAAPGGQPQIPHRPIVLAPGQYGQAPPMYVPASKSVGVAFVLTCFFGPFGMLYSTVAGGLIMLGVVLAAAVLTGIVVGLITLVTMGLGAVLALLAPLVGLALWVVCIIWGCMAASGHNSRLRAQYGHPGMQPAGAPGSGPSGY